MERQIELTAEMEQCLREQAFTSDQPGTVLRDFERLIDFLGTHNGVESAGKFNLLPMKLIGELDRCLSRPLHLELKRPLLKSHPYLQALNLLLRATGLCRVEGAGAKAKLVVDSDMLAQWDMLNSTEQYFNLLEAGLRLGCPEMVGETGRNSGDLVFRCLGAWRSLPAQGKKFNIDKPTDVHIAGIYRDFYQLALMDLFGLVEVERPSRPVQPWCPASVKPVPFGDAVCSLFLSNLDTLLSQHSGSPKYEDEDDDEPDGPQIGVWQPLFQPYFPEWRENLELHRFTKPREGTFIFRVSLGKAWRLIAMPGDATLDDLVAWILRSVNFDSDHLYSVKYRGTMGTTVEALDPRCDDGLSADQIPIGTLPLEPGQSMNMVYDFGDNWPFTITLKKIEPPGTKIKAPRIMESHGKAPEQYPAWDE